MEKQTKLNWNWNDTLSWKRKLTLQGGLNTETNLKTKYYLFKLQNRWKQAINKLSRKSTYLNLNITAKVRSILTDTNNNNYYNQTVENYFEKHSRKIAAQYRNTVGIGKISS